MSNNPGNISTKMSQNRRKKFAEGAEAIAAEAYNKYMKNYIKR